LCDEKIPETLAVFGEVGLGGEIRRVGNTEERVRECARMGFTHCITPEKVTVDSTEEIKVIPAKSLAHLFGIIKKIAT
jgi:DNA repair protein RadA/Sms